MTKKKPGVVNNLSRGEAGMSQTGKVINSIVCHAVGKSHSIKISFLSFFFHTCVWRNKQTSFRGGICLIPSQLKKTHAIKITEPVCIGVNMRGTPEISSSLRVFRDTICVLNSE